MNIRVLASIAGLVTCVLLATTATRQRQVNELQAEQKELLSKVESARTERDAQPATLQQIPVPPELLRLRSEVSRLMEQRTALEPVKRENEVLRAKLNQLDTNASALPPDYIRKKDAQWVGMATPENTLQSFLWAIHNRKPEAVLQLLAPTEASIAFSNQFYLHHEEFFDQAPIPDARAADKKILDDGTVVLKVEFLPTLEESSSTEIRFQNRNGEWKMDLR
jgi:hypothetical protein